MTTNTTKKLSFGILLGIWWAYHWRSFLANLAFSLLFFFLIILADQVVTMQYGTSFSEGFYQFTGSINTLIGALISIYLWKYIIGKSFQGYTLTLKPDHKLPDHQPTFGMLTRIWWLVTWRTIALILLCLVAQPILMLFLYEITGVSPGSFDRLNFLFIVDLVTTLLVLILAFIAAVYVIRDLLHHQFEDFQLQLTKNN